MWRFRKIFNFGNFRTSVSKGGLGYSYGLFGFRFGVSPNGRKYISFGIPGTGLYFMKYLSGRKNNSYINNNNYQQQQQKPPYSVQSKQTNKEPWWKQKDLEKY